MFASESIRSIDLSNILGFQTVITRQNRLKFDPEQARRLCSEVLRPILLLLKNQQCLCNGIILDGNPLASADVEDLGKSNQKLYLAAD